MITRTAERAINYLRWQWSFDDVWTDNTYRAAAITKLNDMTNIELLELLDHLREHPTHGTLDQRGCPQLNER